MDSVFSEPRAWALAWDGAALCPTVDCVSQRKDAKDTAASPVGWAPQWQQHTAAAMPVSRNGHGKNGLRSPRGWALQWDAAALTEGLNGQSASHPRVAEPVQEGVA